jgi:hypothetical protein
VIIPDFPALVWVQPAPVSSAASIAVVSSPLIFIPVHLRLEFEKNINLVEWSTS